MKVNIFLKKVNVVTLYPFLLSLIFALILTGCVSSAKQASRVHPQQFSQKAIVITKVNRATKPFPQEVDFHFAKVDLRYPDKEKRFYYSSPTLGEAFGSMKYNFMMIEPGTYVLENLFYDTGAGTHWSTLDGLNPGTEHFVYGGFTISPGEIIYLGDLDVKMDNNDLQITITDKYDNAIAAFLKKYPEFANHPIKKRFLLPRGTLLNQVQN